MVLGLSLPFIDIGRDVYMDAERQFLYVFSVAARILDAAKIGVTSNPHQRIRTIQTAMPFRLDCIGLWEFRTREDADDAEFTAHKLCSVNRLRGEWFSMTPCALSMASASAKMFGGVPCEPYSYELGRVMSRDKASNKDCSMASCGQA